MIDIGTNSTRLLIADVDGESVRTHLRTSIVTRLGDGVDSGKRISREAAERVLGVLHDYRAQIEEMGATRNMAVLTSAVRDAGNGPDFTARVRALGLDAHVLSGEEEAELTFLGAMNERPRSRESTVVIDIGGGSTEFVIGHDHTATYHASLQAGVVRMSERHIRSDPPPQHEMEALEDDIRTTFADGLPADVRRGVAKGIAVAGTATSAAAMDQELDPYDPDRVHGYRLPLASIDRLLRDLSKMDEASRRKARGLHPDRAPTIVAGMALLGEALRAFGLEEIEVSEHDILRGGALRLAGVD